ncbi:MAG: hypothetical protein ACI9WR_001157, partial [Paracoccaceae bacterium]
GSDWALKTTQTLSQRQLPINRFKSTLFRNRAAQAAFFIFMP